MANLISHAEIPSKDLEVSKEFYKKLFDWEFKPFGNGYLLYNSHKGLTIGLKKVDEVMSGNTTIFHIHVDDINLYLEKIKGLNGKVERARTIIPAMGYYALFNDPSGNTIGLYQTNQ